MNTEQKSPRIVTTMRGARVDKIRLANPGYDLLFSFNNLVFSVQIMTKHNLDEIIILFSDQIPGT